MCDDASAVAWWSGKIHSDKRARLLKGWMPLPRDLPPGCVVAFIVIFSSYCWLDSLWCLLFTTYINLKLKHIILNALIKVNISIQKI